MGTGAAVLLVLAALNRHDSPTARMLLILPAAIRAAPAAAAPSPEVVAHILGKTVFGAPVRQTDLDTEWLRFDSGDGACSVDLGPIVNGTVQKLVAGCAFSGRSKAAAYLNEMVTAMNAEWHPPVIYGVDAEIAHIAVILVHRRPVAAEAYLSEEGNDRWRATVVLAVGGRSVVPQ
ncbi:MAG: hypothetical protein ACXV7D_01105 [Thermoanaerobaculia bacterium]